MIKSLERECSSRALGHSACFKSMLRTIIMQGLLLVAIISAENARVDVNWRQTDD